ncbi:hypothetical protein FA15DRAFT_756238 [Coprinopsis marcescibilis]|uniref:Uncharacterized protein n=1 Tax=Coprinopsis marcescibilis TaxID=230819 RepID=A0A5C3KXI3_COPMA|nr:hypothetical protein FA15DRAFT_756238 [Coprinopsis marcescibilis]
MGGSAFSSRLAKEAIPRLPPKVYDALKARLVPILSELYSLVAVPIEAPEKTSHGDLDILVGRPNPSNTSFGSESVTYLPHSLVKATLGARIVVEAEENRTSNYAVPVLIGEWEQFGHGADERRAREAVPDGEIYYQIDIHACIDEEEFQRIKFYHSYGDLNMILSLMVRNLGLKLGQTGLWIPDPPNPPFLLSANFKMVLPFLGLSLETYSVGFTTKSEVFKWVRSMKYFDPGVFQTKGEGIRKVPQDRRMYHEFVEWVSIDCTARNLGTEQLLHSSVREQALLYFNKASEREAMVASRNINLRAKSALSFHLVQEWAAPLRAKDVKTLISAVKNHLGGNEGLAEFARLNGEEELKKLVMELKKGIDQRAPAEVV